MTVKIENKPNAEGKREKTLQQFIQEYSSVLETKKEFKDDVVEFSELMAKHPADIFIVPSFEKGKACEQIRQGDIYLFRKGEKSEGTKNNVMYDKYIKTLDEHTESKSMNLQYGESITGDHKVIPLKGTTVKITECSIDIPVQSWGGKGTSKYQVKKIVADGPFAVVHGEHGNITCQKGTYLACTQLDARTMTRMKD